jgi:RNA polymerase sigma factor (TIGR02999 family)
LVPILYEDLKKMARLRLNQERESHTLTPTALVNEFYLRLIQNRRLNAENRKEFFAIASQTMRRVLVDYARSRNRLKRGGKESPIPLDEIEPWLSQQESDEVLALEAALLNLSVFDERAVKVVELRFFGGLTLEEIGELLNVSSKTVQRIWVSTRAWLRKEIRNTVTPVNSFGL